MNKSESVVIKEDQPLSIQKRELILSPVMDLELAKSRMEQFQQFVQYYLEPSQDGGMDGGDYGPIPGAGKKKVLLKSGADKLCELYGLYDEYHIQEQEDFELKLFYYKITCILKSRRDDSVVGTGLGSCSTYESKYRWRDEQRKCPRCGEIAIIFGKEEYIKPDGTGYYLCFKKKGGCGIGYKQGDQSIESQKIGRIENPDIMDTVNTVLKMAKKRAKIDAVIGVTRSSGIFTQDLDDVPMPPIKPPIERTTEDIPITRHSAPTQQTTAKGNPNGAVRSGEGEAPPKGGAESHSTAADQVAPTVQATPLSVSLAAPTSAHTPAVELPPVESTLVKQAEANISPKLGALPADHIEDGQASNFERMFKDALKPALRKRATELSHAWLKQQDIVDGNGVPTAKAILKQNFYEVREAAIDYAASLQL